MFAELEDYRRCFPRCLRLDSLESVLTKGDGQKAGKTKAGTVEAVTKLGQRALVPDLSRIEPASSAVVPTPSPSRSRFTWNLGAVDPVQVQVVVAHYRHRYPALDWGWLLPALAELRLVGEPRLAVSSFAVDHQLGSAQTLIERFIQDVGLWVVVEEE
ncbi:hypothetical protein [Synechococcus sp. CS-1328]|uniref:hypothetical protein n=1 Tax=Synechococcus sp. CS-1328 TaxID=2847976 RepID=UPI00223BC6F1|nr:hypothetical protein [Synechococcus sp. CS-1328]MCT0224831.1 hypothetical protein [Synechococcus sp. CS-1328]